MSECPPVELDSVAKSYGDTRVIDAANLSVAAGECLVLIGHNGSGKTTLMKLLLGLIRPTAGKVRVFGEDPVSGSSAARRGSVGYLPESIAFDPAMSGRELLNFYAALKGVNGSQCERLLDQVGIAHAADRRLGTWSKGMRQRLGLAQAMLGDPRLLLLDEPTSGLDPLLRKTFYGIVDALLADGVTVLISSHSLKEVAAHADRVGIIRQGQIPLFGTPDELSAQADLPVTMQIHCAPEASASVAERLAATASTTSRSVCQVDEHTVEIACTRPEKMQLLQEVVQLGEDVIDVDIRLPQLDEIYAHFMPAAEGSS